jgi:hypothetical protein
MVRNAAALLLLLFLTIGVYWKLTISNQYTWLENPDNANQVRPWLEYQAREFHAHRIPLWDPYEWAGQPLIAQVLPGLTNPLNWVLFAAPLRDGHISTGNLHWYWVLIHWVAAIFCYALCRDLGASRGRAIAGGCIYGFAGYIGHATTPQFLTSSLGVPIVLLFMARVWRGHRPVASAAGCGAALGLSFFGGHHNVPIYLSVIVGGFWLCYLVAAKRRAILPILIFAGVAGTVGAVQVLPTIEYGRQAVRWVGAPQPQHWNERVPYSVHAEYSLYARGVPGLVIPRLGVHAEPFVGICALSLAIAAILTRPRSPDVRLLAVVALAGLLLALGRDTPVHRIVYTLIPMVEKARYPAMAIVICQCAIAALASLADLTHPRRYAYALAAVGVAGLAVYFTLQSLGRIPVDHPGRIVAVVALALAVWAFWLRANSAVLIALVIVEVFAFPIILQRRDIPNSYAAMIGAQSDVAGFLSSQPGWFRVDFDEDVVPYNFGEWHGVEQWGGYVAGMPERTLALAGQQKTPRMLGVRYHVGVKPSNPEQVEVFQSRSGLKVYQNPGVGEALWALHPVLCPKPDSLAVVTRLPGRSVFEADLACPGIVVTGDIFYRGWQARVDGVRVPVQEIEGAVRGVAVPVGRHRIEYDYRPASVYLGAALTALGLMVAAAMLLSP